MDDKHERLDVAGGRRRCECHKDEGICHVLMNSREYGTEVWPCDGLDEAIETLGQLARAAEQRRQVDGIQRYFCIRGELPEETETAASDPVSPTIPDMDALTLTIHFRQDRTCREPEVRRCQCSQTGETQRKEARR